VSVTHDWNCLAHGVFEARGNPKKPPRCPKGCSSSFVELIRLVPPGMVSARTRTGDRLVREMATTQGLSDISTSPSRPGGSVGQRNRAKSQGAAANPYPEQYAARSAGLKEFLSGMTYSANELTNVGLGHKYNASEWTKDDKTGATRHVGAQGPNLLQPGASVDRVRR
jgi:hypothetical protein